MNNNEYKQYLTALTGIVDHVKNENWKAEQAKREQTKREEEARRAQAEQAARAEQARRAKEERQRNEQVARNYVQDIRNQIKDLDREVFVDFLGSIEQAVSNAQNHLDMKELQAILSQLKSHINPLQQNHQTLIERKATEGSKKEFFRACTLQNLPKSLADQAQRLSRVPEQGLNVWAKTDASGQVLHSFADWHHVKGLLCISMGVVWFLDGQTCTLEQAKQRLKDEQQSTLPLRVPTAEEWQILQGKPHLREFRASLPGKFWMLEYGQWRIKDTSSNVVISPSATCQATLVLCMNRP